MRPDTPGRETRQPAKTTPWTKGEELMRTCPVCGSALEERKCKLTCPDPRCTYFLSCADYY